MREKSGYTFIRISLLPELKNVRPRLTCGTDLQYKFDLDNTKHIVHLRDYRDMAISQYWNTWTHALGGRPDVPAQLELLGKDPKNPKMTIDEFIKREGPCIEPDAGVRFRHLSGYTLRYFKEAFMVEYDKLLENITSNPETIKIVYYEDMVTDFKFYLSELHSFGVDVDVGAVYQKFKDDFQPEPGPWDSDQIALNTWKGFKRRVAPGAHKEEMSDELSEEFAALYKKYFFLHKYLEKE